MSLSSGARVKINHHQIITSDDFPEPLYDWIHSHERDQIYTISRAVPESPNSDDKFMFYIRNDDDDESPESLYPVELILQENDWDG